MTTGDGGVDGALDGLWLFDIGQGELAAALARAQEIAGASTAAALCARGVVYALRRHYRSALECFERAYAGAGNDAMLRGTVAALGARTEAWRDRRSAPGVLGPARRADQTLWMKRVFESGDASALVRLLAWEVGVVGAGLRGTGADLRGGELAAGVQQQALQQIKLATALSQGSPRAAAWLFATTAELLGASGFGPAAEQVLAPQRQSPDAVVRAWVSVVDGDLSAGDTARAAYQRARALFGAGRGAQLAGFRIAFLDRDAAGFDAVAVAAAALGDRELSAHAEMAALWVRWQDGAARGEIAATFERLVDEARRDEAAGWLAGWGDRFVASAAQLLGDSGDVERAVAGWRWAAALFTAAGRPERGADAMIKSAQALDTIEADVESAEMYEAALASLTGGAASEIDDVTAANLLGGLVNVFIGKQDDVALEALLPRLRSLLARIPRPDVAAVLHQLGEVTRAMASEGLPAIARATEVLGRVPELLARMSAARAIVEGAFAVPLIRHARARAAGDSAAAAAELSRARAAIPDAPDRNVFEARWHGATGDPAGAVAAIERHEAAGSPQGDAELMALERALAMPFAGTGLAPDVGARKVGQQRLAIAILRSARAWPEAYARVVALDGPQLPAFDAAVPSRAAIIALLDRGEIAHGVGRTDEARAAFVRAVEGLELRRRVLRSERFRRAAGAQVTTRAAYIGLARAQARAGQWDLAFATADLARARTLAEELLRPSRDREEAGKVERLFTQLALARRHPEQPDAIAALTAELAVAQRALDDAMEAASDSHAVFSVASIEQIRARLPADTAVLAHIFGGDELLGWAITSAGTTTARVDRLGDERFAADVFSSRLQQLVAAIERGDNVDELIAQMSAALVTPFADVLGGVKRIVLLPYAELGLVPFALLDLAGQPLGVTHTLTTLPSAALAAESRPRHPAPREVLVVGNPTAMSYRAPGGDVAVPQVALRGAEEEARAVADHHDVEPLVGPAATRDAVLTALRRRPRIVHLATHGIFEPDAPLASSILLASGECLTAEDLLAVQLDADVVIFSACHSARGRLQGSEMVGLARTTLQAGAAAVISSQWSVDDASAVTFMSTLHQHLASGATVDDALREAMRASRTAGPDADAGTRRDFVTAADAAAPGRRDPAAWWAPFVLVRSGL